jgi:hypothetical protein
MINKSPAGGSKIKGQAKNFNHRFTQINTDVVGQWPMLLPPSSQAASGTQMA